MGRNVFTHSHWPVLSHNFPCHLNVMVIQVISDLRRTNFMSVSFFMPELPRRPPNLLPRLRFTAHTGIKMTQMQTHPILLLSNNTSLLKSTNCVIIKNLTFDISVFKMYFFIYFLSNVCFCLLIKHCLNPITGA
jgi:hypothetical protein